MKRSIYTLTTITLAVAGFVVADSMAAGPAMAQGARFVFEPNKWKTADHDKPSGRYLNQIRNPQPVAAVSHGSMPHGNSLLGVDPTFLSKAPPPPIVRTNVTPTITAAAPRMVPQMKPTPYNAQFGSPLQAQQPPMLAQTPPAQFGSPIQPSGTTNQGVHGRLSPPRQPVAHVARAHSLHGKMMRPAQPRALASEPKVLTWNSGYSKGSTAPHSSGSGIKSSTSVNGVVLHK